MLDVRLEPFDPAAYRELLERWVRRPHVVEWWGPPEKTLAELEPFMRSPDSNALIVADGVPAGYVCWQAPPAEDLEAAGLTDLPDALMDVDIMIGEPEMIGRGIGSMALTLLVERLRNDPSVEFVGLAPSIHNARAIRAYEKAGFRKLREFLDPECGPAQYMIQDLRPGEE